MRFAGPTFRFPRLYAAASLKLLYRVMWRRRRIAISAALCRGLIEARQPNRHAGRSSGRFPRLYAAASLKRLSLSQRTSFRTPISAALCRGLIEATIQPASHRRAMRISAALCRGLIEAAPCNTVDQACVSISAALCRGLIEAGVAGVSARVCATGFPRLYAAASLKPDAATCRVRPCSRISAALCRGLIEAGPFELRTGGTKAISAALCRGLIEADRLFVTRQFEHWDFRGFMPRPH